jgi:SAM-dependent methyltransferase
VGLLLARKLINIEKRRLLKWFTGTHPLINIIDVGCGIGGDIMKWDALSTHINQVFAIDKCEESIQIFNNRLKSSKWLHGKVTTVVENFKPNEFTTLPNLMTSIPSVYTSFFAYHDLFKDNVHDFVKDLSRFMRKNNVEAGVFMIMDGGKMIKCCEHHPNYFHLQRSLQPTNMITLTIKGTNIVNSHEFLCDVDAFRNALEQEFTCVKCEFPFVQNPPLGLSIVEQEWLNGVCNLSFSNLHHHHHDHKHSTTSKIGDGDEDVEQNTLKVDEKKKEDYDEDDVAVDEVEEDEDSEGDESINRSGGGGDDDDEEEDEEEEEEDEEDGDTTVDVDELKVSRGNDKISTGKYEEEECPIVTLTPSTTQYGQNHIRTFNTKTNTNIPTQMVDLMVETISSLGPGKVLVVDFENDVSLLRDLLNRTAYAGNYLITFGNAKQLYVGDVRQRFECGTIESPLLMPKSRWVGVVSEGVNSLLCHYFFTSADINEQLVKAVAQLSTKKITFKIYHQKNTIQMTFSLPLLKGGGKKMLYFQEGYVSEWMFNKIHCQRYTCTPQPSGVQMNFKEDAPGHLRCIVEQLQFKDPIVKGLRAQLLLVVSLVNSNLTFNIRDRLLRATRETLVNDTANNFNKLFTAMYSHNYSQFPLKQFADAWQSVEDLWHEWLTVEIPQMKLNYDRHEYTTINYTDIEDILEVGKLNDTFYVFNCDPMGGGKFVLKRMILNCLSPTVIICTTSSYIKYLGKWYKVFWDDNNDLVINVKHIKNQQEEFSNLSSVKQIFMINENVTLKKWPVISNS